MTEKQLEILKQISEQLAERIDCEKCVARQFCETECSKNLTCKDTLATFLKEVFGEN